MEQDHHDSVCRIFNTGLGREVKGSSTVFIRNFYRKHLSTLEGH